MDEDEDGDTSCDVGRALYSGGVDCPVRRHKTHLNSISGMVVERQGMGCGGGSQAWGMK